ncbi:VWA domain-containing protein [Desulforhopalus sp. 52FAK]
MQLTTLKERFFTIVAPSLPNDWEVEDVLTDICDLPSKHIEALFAQITVIWPVSHSLCFAFLQDGGKCISCIPDSLVAEWTRRILGLYETGGLVSARKFMADPKRLFLRPMEGLCGLSFSEIQEKMQLYLNGISGVNIELGIASIPQTDTEKIFVPEFLDLFPDQAGNSLLYKFIISLQWAHVQSRLFEAALDVSGVSLYESALFKSLSDQDRGKELFTVAQCISSIRWLRTNLPGLIRSVRPLYIQLLETLTASACSDYLQAIKGLLRDAIGDGSEQGVTTLNRGHDFISVVERLGSEGVIDVLPDLYRSFHGIDGDCDFGGFSIILGNFDFDRAFTLIHKRRLKDKNVFLTLLAEAIEQKHERKNDKSVAESEQKSGGTHLILSADENINDQKNRDDFLLENGEFELSEELKTIIQSIESDVGELPEAYVQAASGMAGRGVNDREAIKTGDSWCNTPPGLVGYPYDEWDYRRGGYRQGWCTLYEKPVSPVKSTFIPDTLIKYKGQMHRIRRQFEMLRNQNRFVRRRRHGDDIDFDALVDAQGDAKAGLVPSDRLFLRLLRDSREISTCFLVDMSNSTEGWVGTAVKESLVLMAEAMDIVGDPYSIYGFSGMRRSKNEVYPIKELLEPYNSVVKGRIAGISPREYTRMGPPIRHMTKKMMGTDSRVRLLIVFSDGKPEDYDDYKGKYAIEDTRKAILEARGMGVQVFCVTIDKSAHEYLGHMFGLGQFVFIDNVEALPGKLVEMYRLLTC